MKLRSSRSNALTTPTTPSRHWESFSVRHAPTRGRTDGRSVPWRSRAFGRQRAHADQMCVCVFVPNDARCGWRSCLASMNGICTHKKYTIKPWTHKTLPRQQRCRQAVRSSLWLLCARYVVREHADETGEMSARHLYATTAIVVWWRQHEIRGYDTMGTPTTGVLRHRTFETIRRCAIVRKWAWMNELAEYFCIRNCSCEIWKYFAFVLEWTW